MSSQTEMMRMRGAKGGAFLVVILLWDCDSFDSTFPVFFFFNFWDCNLVTLLSFFYSLQTLPYIPLPFPSDSWPLLSLIVIACTYVFICAYTFLNGTCNVPVILLYVCVQGWLLALAHPWCALPRASALESCGTPAWSCPQQSWKKSICKLPRS